MKTTLTIFGIMLLLVGGFWFSQENTRLKVNTENTPSTNIEQRGLLKKDSIEKSLDAAPIAK